MITLPSAYLAEIPQGEPTKRVGWLVGLTLVGAVIKYGATIEGHETGTLFNGIRPHFIVHSISPIRSSLDPFECSHSIANCSIEISETDIVGESGDGNASLQEVLDLSTLGWVNWPIYIYKYIESEAINTTTDCFNVFTGHVADYSYDAVSKKYTIEVAHYSNLQHKELPTSFVTREDHPKSPESSWGMPKPILYGEWDMVNSPSWDYHHNSFHVAPSVCIDSHDGIFLFAHHECKTLNTSDLAVYIDELSTYGYGLKDNAGTYPSTSVAGPTTASFALAAGASYFQIDYIYLIPNLRGTTSAITTEDISKIIDRDVNTTLALTVDYAAKLNFSEPKITFPGAADTTLLSSFNLHCLVTNYLGAPTSRLRIYNAATAAYTDTGAVFSSSGMKDYSFGPNALWAGNRTDRYGDAMLDTDIFSWDEIARYEYVLDVGAGATCTVSVVCISLVDMVIQSSLELAVPPRYTPKPRRDREVSLPYDYGLGNAFYRPGRNHKLSELGISNVFAEIRGRKCGAFIDDVGRANSFNATDTNVLSNFIAESIIRDELGLGSTNIDVASFDDVAESQMTRMAFSVNQQINSRDLLRELGFFSNSIFFPTPEDNIWKIFNFPTTPSTSVADIQFSDIKITRFYWTSMDNLTNEVTIRYQLDYASQKYLGEYHVSDGTSQGASGDGYNYTRHGHFDCPYIRYGTTSSYKAANDWADTFLSNWKDRHICIDFQLQNSLYEGLQIGDQIKLSNIPGDGNSDGFVSYNPFGYATGSPDDCMSGFDAPRTKYFLVIGCERNFSYTSYSCMQLHEIS